MLRYIAQRIGALIITLFIIMSVSFCLIRLTPGDVVADPMMSETVKKAIAQKYHLDEPMIVQYGYFLKDFIRMDFGTSMFIQPAVPVREIMKTKIPVSMQLNIFSLILMVPVGIILGIIAALKKNTFADSFISVLVVLFVSVPGFVFAALLQYFIAFKLGWLPLIFSTDDGLTWNKFASMILPILALSFGGIAGITRYMRAELSEALNSEYMLLAKTKGLTQIQATLRHAMRNSFIPLANIILPMFLGVLGGSLVIEKIFAIPGIGGLSVEAINAKDHNVTMGTMLFYVTISLISTLLVDLSYGIIDPRIRMGGVK